MGARRAAGAGAVSTIGVSGRRRRSKPARASASACASSARATTCRPSSKRTSARLDAGRPRAGPALARDDDLPGAGGRSQRPGPRDEGEPLGRGEDEGVLAPVGPLQVRVDGEGDVRQRPVDRHAGEELGGGGRGSQRRGGDEEKGGQDAFRRRDARRHACSSCGRLLRFGRAPTRRPRPLPLRRETAQPPGRPQTRARKARASRASSFRPAASATRANRAVARSKSARAWTSPARAARSAR